MGDRVYNSQSELLEQASLIKGKSLIELYGINSKKSYNGKGGLGNKIEELHYQIENNSNPKPDVANLNIEIKTNSLKQNLDNEIVPKESVALGMIDFTKLASENFESSSYIKKNKNILFNMYLYNPNHRDYEYKFILIDLIELDEIDKIVIRRDWELIRDKVKRLEAHKLSQSDTQYLIALTKGQRNQKEQPYLNGRAKAKRRAFAYKKSYIKHLISKYKFNSKKGYFEYKGTNNTFTLLEERHSGNIENAVREKFAQFINKTDFEIAENFNQKSVFLLKKDKARWHYNTSLILTGQRKKNLSKHIEEFSKSGLTVKTIRVNKDSRPLEDVSFRTQDYQITEQSTWQDSSLFEEMSRKFLWVIYKETNENNFVLQKVIFWDMPKNDLDFLRGKWLDYKSKILTKDYKPSYFMNEESFYYLKIKDNKGGANKKLENSLVTSLGHWFRKLYIQNIITN